MAFNSFPVAAQGLKSSEDLSTETLLSILSQLLRALPSPPSCASYDAYLSILSQLLPAARRGERAAARALSILSQLLLPRAGGGGGRGRGRAFNSFPVAAGGFRCTLAGFALPLLSILSQLLRLHDLARPSQLRLAAFQFFPSCCPRRRHPGSVRLRGFFQFFPSCCRGENPHGGEGERAGDFQFFPSCCTFGVSAAEDSICSVLSLSILSQLLRIERSTRSPSAGGWSLSFQFFPSCCIQNYNRRARRYVRAFNSFPVAAEALASCPLLSLSSANSEVPESSPALPPDACSGSRKPFPDSRRKEGIWRERNRIEQKR